MAKTRPLIALTLVDVSVVLAVMNHWVGSADDLLTAKPMELELFIVLLIGLEYSQEISAMASAFEGGLVPAYAWPIAVVSVKDGDTGHGQLSVGIKHPEATDSCVPLRVASIRKQ